MSKRTTVALCHGTQRAANLRCALDRVIDEIDWPSCRNVVVKPNLVMPSQPAAVTHHDALAAVLEAVRTRYGGVLTIAEGCALDSTTEAFAALGYDTVASFYRARLVDLNADRTTPVTVYDRRAGPLRVRLARHIVESDCRISLSLPKTHDAVLVTLSIKNMVMGSLVNRRVTGSGDRPAWQDRLGQIVKGHGNGWGSDKTAMHQGYAMLNINLALLAGVVRPHLSVLDGFTAMEGAGPSDGTPVPWHIAVAGTDPLAVDVFTAHLMGFGLDEIGYLHYCAQLGLGCANLEAIQLTGDVAPEIVRRRFAPHPRHEEQRRWHHPDATRLLCRDPRAST
jgi:uncharacterized protein (DUF362 family)